MNWVKVEPNPKDNDVEAEDREPVLASERLLARDWNTREVEEACKDL